MAVLKNNYLKNIGQKAKAASLSISNLSTNKKNQILKSIAELLIINEEEILKANLLDLEVAREKGTSENMVDRLTLNKKRIQEMSEGLLQLISLPDPIGEVVSMWKRPNGLQIGQRRVPLGVIGIIYESRPNVTVDAAGLCIKTGNAVILRGGSEAINSNLALIKVIKECLMKEDLPDGGVQLIEVTDRETVKEMMRMNKYIDVLIPRGSSRLIQSVLLNATIPVLETGVGNCHIYVDSKTDLKMAEEIIINAKVSRPSACNAAEKLLVHKAVAEKFLPHALRKLSDLNVEIRGCRKTCSIFPEAKKAKEEDWHTEYLDFVLGVKVVDSFEDAISHINKYGSRHSEAIITSDYVNSQKFHNEVDAAAVYVNASTRFTDGFEFGFGAEIGISTQKLHARGPMGLKELTSIKYIIFGNGQIR